MSNIESEMTPEQEAATYSELAKLFDEKTTDTKLVTLSDDKGLVDMFPDHEVYSRTYPRVLIDLVEQGDTRGLEGSYAFNEAGELVAVYPGGELYSEPQPKKAAEFLERLKTGTHFRAHRR